MRKVLYLLLCSIMIFQTLLPAQANNVEENLVDNTNEVVTVNEDVNNTTSNEVDNLSNSLIDSIDSIYAIESRILYERIKNNENMFVISGDFLDDKKEFYEQISELTIQMDDNVKEHIVKLNESSELKVNEFCNEEDGRKLQELLDTNKDIFFTTYNGHLKKMFVLGDGKAEELTWRDVAIRELSIAYNDLLNQSNTQMVYALNQDTWSFAAKPMLQTFTAPVSGNYSVDLWGADGDSDMGAKAHGVNADTLKHTTGIGGAAGYTHGVVHLNKGDKIYLALGLRNNMSERRSYNGGGKGFGALYSYRSGGGGAASAYVSARGNGEIINYQDYQDEILMIAGGGGGSEDLFAPTHQIYYCNNNPCITSIGGAGGSTPTGGTSSGPTGIGGGYKFGIGQDYASYENASSGAGGGGLYGGTSANDEGNILKGGTGGGGQSFINEKLVKEGTMSSKTPLTFTWKDDIFGWDNGENAKAKIQLVNVDKYNLTINYIDKYTNEKLTDSYIQKIGVEEQYYVETPTITGYSIIDEQTRIIDGIMPEHDVEINVYFDYSKITINYLDYDSKENLATSIEERIKTGLSYNYVSPEIANYLLFDDIDINVEGTKTDKDEVYDVYYVKKVEPIKDIIKVNDIDITKETSNSGVEVKVGDILTYEITITNNRNVDVQETIKDKLEKSLEFVEVLNGDTYTYENSIITWNVTVPKRSVKKLVFKAKVIESDNQLSVDNWDRKDPLIKMEVVKKAMPKHNSYVGYNEEITYSLMVKNTSKNTIRNIVVVDKIPANTEFLNVDRDYHGKYDKENNYVSYLIDEIKPAQLITLRFKVKTTSTVVSDSVTVIENEAVYLNIPELSKQIDTTLEKMVFEKGVKTNKVIHYLDQIKLDATKTANPVENTPVGLDELISYNIQVNNTGNVKANYFRITDDIPVGTQYVENSISFISDNKEASNKKAVSYGDFFDVSYDFNTNTYNLFNVSLEQLNLTNSIKSIVLNIPSNLKVNSNSIPSIWNMNVHNNTYTFTKIGGASSNEGRDLIKNLKITGEYGGIGTIRFDINTEIMTDFTSTTTPGEFRAPVSGKYRVELWGAEGGSEHRTGGGGKGGFVSGEINLDKNQLLFTKVGAIGWGNLGWNSHIQADRRPANGGGVQKYEGANGGGATHAALVNRGDLKNYESYKDEVLLVAGGGGAKFHAIGGGNSGTGGAGFGQGSDACEYAAGGGGWNGGSCDGLGGTNHINSRMTNTINRDGVSTVPGMKITLLSYDKAANTVNISTEIPNYENTGSCKYVTNNGDRPYVECIGIDLNPGQKANLSFDVKVIDNTLDQIENVGLYENSWLDIGKAGDIKVKPKNKTNTVIHPINGKLPVIEGVKDSIPISGSYVDILDKITYQIKITNSGNAKANYVVVREYIPEHTTYTDNSISDNGTYVNNESTSYVEWVLKDVMPLEERIVQYTVDVDDDIPYGFDIIRNALYERYVEYPGDVGTITQEPKEKTNETIHKINEATTQEGKIEIDVIKSSNPNDLTSIARDSVIEYTLHVENKSLNKTSRIITVRDFIPQDTTFVKFNKHITDDKNVKITERYVEGEKPYVEWELNMLKAKKYVDLKFEVKVDKEAMSKEIVNKAMYGESVNRPTEVDKNDILTNETNVIKHPVIEPVINVVKNSKPLTESVVGKNAEITYELVLENKGIVNANYVGIKDTIPAELEILDYEIVDANSEDKIYLNKDNRTVECLIKDLGINEKKKIIINTRVKENVKSGKIIINEAFYDVFIKKPTTNDISAVSKKTNKTVHYLDAQINSVPTGGEGWSSTMKLLSCIAVIIGCYLFNKGGGKM